MKLTNLWTERDNDTLCPVKIGGWLSCVGYHAGAVFGFFSGAIHADIATLGQYVLHMGSLFASMGVASGIRTTLKDTSQ